MRNYNRDEKLGQEAVNVFTEHLSNTGVKYCNADRQAQINGIDIITPDATYEVKHQSFTGSIVIEESDGLRQGWIYTSKSDYLINANLRNGSFIQIPMQKLRWLYDLIKGNYRLMHNDFTDGARGDVWQGSYRIIPITNLEGFIPVEKFKIALF